MHLTGHCLRGVSGKTVGTAIGLVLLGLPDNMNARLQVHVRGHKKYVCMYIYIYIYTRVMYPQFHVE